MLLKVLGEFRTVASSAVGRLDAMSRIEPDPDAAHIEAMVAKSAKLSAGSPSRGKGEGWYRGVKLQSPPTPPKTSLSRLQAAVKHAVAKNADALAGRK